MFSTNRKGPGYDLSTSGAGKPRPSKALMYSQNRRLYSRGRQADEDHDRWAALGAWFLGPKAENGDLFKDLLTKAVDSHIGFRQSYFPSDPPYITDDLRGKGAFKNSLQTLRSELEQLQKDLSKSVPFFSSRYKGHVNWDTAMPANLGYITALFFNQNNCAAEGSPVTTKLEVEVGTDLSVMVGYDKDKCMGHLTTGGSVANIEAVWAARNVKYFPLGLQEALLKEDKFAHVRGYKVFFPQLGKEKEVAKASKWELLNLDVDTILKMPSNIETLLNLEHQEFMEIMGKYLYESIGAQEFSQRHGLTQSACVIAPSTLHISFMKAITILGLGRENIVTVAVDENARMDPKDLTRILTLKLEKEIPVISVVAIMGTTEESAVDPLTEVLNIREKFSKQGLNFSVHGDAAWGAYFCSMMRDEHRGVKMIATGFVSEMYLSKYVSKQLSMLKYCDTITIDPHKSGFCPYPAGAICYRDKTMNSFLQITTGAVYYHGDMTLGDIGIEGSKPGAAAAGVMLANRVIGLHKNGYGRLLAECMFTAKILYCLWVTLANEDDNFVLVTTKPLPKFNEWSEEQQIKFIRERILGKTNEELVKDKQAMEYLKEVGPDTMIPCFSVNLKGNNKVELCNAINSALFNDLCHSSSEQTAHRIPLLVTSSSMVPHKHSNAVLNLKKRLGLDTNTDDSVKYIITTCMDPWPTSLEFMDDMAAIMRNSILCAIGTVKDPDAFHTFVSTGACNDDDEVIAYYVGNFNKASNQYDTVVKLKFTSNKEAQEYRETQKLLESSNQNQPIVFRSTKQRLHDVFFKTSEYAGEKEKFHCFVGFPSDDDHPFMEPEMKIVDVPRYEHYDNGDYPQYSAYFMYGDKKETFLFHIPAKSPDLFQVVQLEGPPAGVGNQVADDILIRYGTVVDIPSIPGNPTVSGGEIQDPLKKHEFDISFVGIDGQEVTSKVKISRKIWFAGSDKVYK
ncbi:L-tyrosine decarboxylase [Acropora cervicornis]|uniref:L-tyrosine decarboxylase n=1 Tax=Acropora cervicornis TaxID=6130 RepID=A0AAD9VB16_ACRCE|nr:L-tyrosine decarboxylase [Acropora cervicornis]